MTHPNSESVPELPEVVAEQLPAVVADQLPGVVAGDGEASRFNENKDRLDRLDQAGTATDAVAATQQVTIDRLDLAGTATDAVAATQRDLLTHLDARFVAERKRTNRRTVTMFAAAIALFLVPTVAVQLALAGIRDNTHTIAVNSWNTCTASIKSRTSINATNQAFVDVLAAVKPRTPAVTKLLDVYQAGILPIPVCGPKP